MSKARKDLLGRAPMLLSEVEACLKDLDENESSGDYRRVLEELREALRDILSASND